MKIEQGLQNERIESERLLLVPISMEYKDAVFCEFSDVITAYMGPAPAKGIHAGILKYIDIIVPTINDALDLFIDPNALIATMRI